MNQREVERKNRLERIERTRAQLLQVCTERQITITADERVSETDAAVLLGCAAGIFSPQGVPAIFSRLPLGTGGWPSISQTATIFPALPLGESKVWKADRPETAPGPTYRKFPGSRRGLPLLKRQKT